VLIRWVGVLLAVTLLQVYGISWASSQPPADTSFPPLLNAYISRYVGLTPAERASLLAGNLVVRLLPADPSKEVSVFGAVWINGSRSAYVKLVSDIEHFERGRAFRITKRISDPPRLADFALLKLPEEDIAALKTCRVGACEIKLSEDALERIHRTIDWTKPTATADVEQLIRQIVYEYVTGYVEAGNDRLAVYRDSSRPTFVAAEFRSMIDRMPELGEQLPDLRAYLLGYPRVTIPNATSFLYWQETRFGLKPTIRINHLVIDDRPGVTAVAIKLIYASHYFWTALDLRVLVPDPSRGPGFWFANVTRSRSDGLDGFVGTLIRGKVRNEAQKGLAAVLRVTKERVEAIGDSEVRVIDGVTDSGVLHLVRRQHGSGRDPHRSSGRKHHGVRPGCRRGYQSAHPARERTGS
jgi:hypothetical protein